MSDPAEVKEGKRELSVQELKAAVRLERDGRVRDRLRLILLVRERVKLEAAAKSLGFGVRWGYKWNARYRDRGFTIVGVHTPETQSEYVIDIVRREVPGLGIKYAVVTDNDYKTWNAYHVEAWPTMFVLDKQSRIRWLHVGEGSYEET